MNQLDLGRTCASASNTTRQVLGVNEHLVGNMDINREVNSRAPSKLGSTTSKRPQIAENHLISKIKSISHRWKDHEASSSMGVVSGYKM